MIEREILPAIGDRKVAEVHEGDIEALRRGIAERGRAVRANRVLAVASKMFSLALRRKEGEDAPWRNQMQGNPCKGAARNREDGHERFFSAAELAALGDALAVYGHTPASDCLRFVMLTGCRPGEAIHATWDQFDAEPGFWVKPSAHTKQRKVHRVPLAAAAMELLERIRAEREKTPRRAKSDFVFPGQSQDEPLKQLRSTWEAVTASASVALWRDAKDPRVAPWLPTSSAASTGSRPSKRLWVWRRKLGLSCPPPRMTRGFTISATPSRPLAPAGPVAPNHRPVVRSHANEDDAALCAPRGRSAQGSRGEDHSDNRQRGQRQRRRRRSRFRQGSDVSDKRAAWISPRRRIVCGHFVAAKTAS